MRIKDLFNKINSSVFGVFLRNPVGAAAGGIIGAAHSDKEIYIGLGILTLNTLASYLSHKYKIDQIEEIKSNGQ